LTHTVGKVSVVILLLCVIHYFRVVTVKKMVKIGVIYGSYRKIKPRVSLFGPLCTCTYRLKTQLNYAKQQYPSKEPETTITMRKINIKFPSKKTTQIYRS